MAEENNEFSEDEAEILAGVTDSTLPPPDFVDDSERQHVLNIAPGEGNRPLSVFKDKYSKELAYPGTLGNLRHCQQTMSMLKHYGRLNANHFLPKVRL